MSLLRNEDDQSINFQRASCTLDGCVKIWTSRVDSVGTETGKLMNNLQSEHLRGGEEDEDDPTQSGADRATKKRHRKETTLAKKETLRGKKPDVEFSVDPLFKKTSADFDEGGAGGLLMNHLSLGIGADGGMRVVFDASDSLAQSAQDEEEMDLDVPEEDVDLAFLMSQSVVHPSRCLTLNPRNRGCPRLFQTRRNGDRSLTRGFLIPQRRHAR